MQFKELHSLFHDICEFFVAVYLFLGAGISCGHLQAGFACQNFHRFHKAHIFGTHDKADHVAFFLTAKTVVVALAVIDVETRRFFLMKRAGGPIVAFGLVGFFGIPNDLPPRHLGKGQTVSYFIKETRWQTHVCNMGFGTEACKLLLRCNLNFLA